MFFYASLRQGNLPEECLREHVDFFPTFRGSSTDENLIWAAYVARKEAGLSPGTVLHAFEPKAGHEEQVWEIIERMACLYDTSGRDKQIEFLGEFTAGELTAWPGFYFLRTMTSLGHDWSGFVEVTAPITGEKQIRSVCKQCLQADELTEVIEFVKEGYIRVPCKSCPHATITTAA